VFFGYFGAVRHEFCHPLVMQTWQLNKADGANETELANAQPRGMPSVAEIFWLMRAVSLSDKSIQVVDMAMLSWGRAWWGRNRVCGVRPHLAPYSTSGSRSNLIGPTTSLIGGLHVSQYPSKTYRPYRTYEYNSTPCELRLKKRGIDSPASIHCRIDEIKLARLIILLKRAWEKLLILFLK
jgi:hypothetical protein